jgi:hypothetical protein
MSRKKPTFTKPFDEALIRARLIEEMMIEDGWSKFDESLFANKETLALFARHANAALRVFKWIEERENNIRPSELD